MKKLEFAESAFKHGFGIGDFFELTSGRYVKLRSQRGLRDNYELLGQNLTGDYLHIIYRVIHSDTIRVFHIGVMAPQQKRRFKDFIKR